MAGIQAKIFLGVAGLALAQEPAGPPWSARNDIPSGCETVMKVPDGGRCLFDDQCVSGFCCPFYRSCIGANPGYLEYDAVAVDPVRHAMMWGIGGETGSVDGVANHVLEGATDTCDRDRPSSSDQIGLCNGYTMNDEYTINLQEQASYLPAFDLMHPDCKCDPRFKDLYASNAWTGAFINGEFRNYCELHEWEYILSPTGASACPDGRSIITDVAECQNAIAYLGLGDSTSYMDGHFGAAAFPGCVNNAGNSQVAFNADNQADYFSLSSVEQFVCKRGEGSDFAAWEDSANPRACGTVSPELRQRLQSKGFTPVGCNE